jgi:hypothetical protein
MRQSTRLSVLAVGAVAVASLTLPALTGTAVAATFPHSPGAGQPHVVPAGATSDGGRARVFHNGDRGKTVHLAVGQTVKISLRTCVDCGESWHYVDRPKSSVVKVLGKRMKAYQHAPGTAGYPYHTIYTLRADGTGGTTIRLAEYASFDKHKKQDATHFRLTFEVRK